MSRRALAVAKSNKTLIMCWCAKRQFSRSCGFFAAIRAMYLNNTNRSFSSLIERAAPMPAASGRSIVFLVLVSVVVAAQSIHIRLIDLAAHFLFTIGLRLRPDPARSLSEITFFEAPE